jgi:nicotinate-nucleotide adenylyltransferase
MKIAIYSGSFNPIHNGHIAVAQAVLDDGYDEVWLVVSPQNPHKNDDVLWPFEERLKMVEMALTDKNDMKACDCENHLPRPSYTINTLEFLKETHPQHQFMLLIGGDNLIKFHLWKDYNRILESFGLIVYPRSSGEYHEMGNHPNIHTIKAPLLEISSTNIRQRLALNQSIHGLVSTEVENYILQKLKNDQSNSVFLV